MTSHFHTGTFIQFAWDSTSLGLFKECPRKYFYSIIMGYQPTGGTSPHLVFGIHYHAGLEFYDKLRAHGVSHEPALAQVVEKLLVDTWSADGPWVSDHPLKTRENLIRSVIWYLEEFGDNDPARTIILANGAPAVELSFRFEADDDLVLCGHLDRVVDFAGGAYVMDRKTASSMPGSYYFNQYDPDNQMSLYTIAAKVVYNTPVKGVIIDAAQIAVGFTRFIRGTTFRTEGRISEWLAETSSWTVLACDMAERMGATPAERFWPQNDKSCNNFGGCKFREVCSRDPRVRQNFIDSAYQVKQWQPLVPR